MGIPVGSDECVRVVVAVRAVDELDFVVGRLDAIEDPALWMLPSCGCCCVLRPP